MNNKILVFLLIILVSVINVNAVTDCPERGNFSIELNKLAYQQGERLSGDLLINNINVKASSGKMTVKLYKGNEFPWEITTSIKDINAGEQVLPIYEFIKSLIAIPTNAEISKDWIFEVILWMDNCVFYDYKPIEVFSCSDKVMNGDEKGIDCEGSCQTDCPKSTQFQGQVIYRRAYYRTLDDYDWRETTINKLPLAKTFQSDSWIDGSKISVNMPKETYMLAAYGCCCRTCDESNFIFNCDYVRNTRYKLETYGIWECGWNIQ
ncbi:MAG: hypothetical protein V1824_01650 [archaeon]